jgi:hypothetical protein
MNQMIAAFEEDEEETQPTQQPGPAAPAQDTSANEHPLSAFYGIDSASLQKPETQKSVAKKPAAAIPGRKSM